MKELFARFFRPVMLCAAFAGLPAAAQQFVLAVDVPSSLGGTQYGANQIIQYDSGTGGYSLRTDLGAALGAAGHINALTQVSQGVYYLAVDVPTTISGTTYQPNDIVRESEGAFSLAQSGSGLGIPAGVGIGAITRMPATGAPVIALTAPATIAGSTYLPGDLIQLDGTTLSLYWRSTNYGIPAGARLAGAEIMANNDLLAQYDIPVSLAGQTFAPGEVLRFSGSYSPTPFFDDVDFPQGSAMTDFALPGSPGATPDGTAFTTPLTVSRGTQPDTLVLSWGASCSTEATGYGVYEGSLGNWYGHAAVGCLGNVTTVTLTPDSGNCYFLVTPNNGDYEGSYGKDSSGGEIPPSGSTCQTIWAPSSCP